MAVCNAACASAMVYCQPPLVRLCCTENIPKRGPVAHIKGLLFKSSQRCGDKNIEHPRE